LAVFVSLFVIIISDRATSQTLPIYPGAVPNSKTGHQLISQKNNPDIIYTVLKPELEVFLPKKEKATGAAVIICPGGSYKVLVYQAEGVNTAKTFAENGIAAFVLKYRLPDDSAMVDKTIGPLQDAQQAMKFVRENARQWQINDHRIGVMGFSAGGHLASTLATHFNKALISNTEKTNLRPDFLILVYPVISMQDSLTHQDSRHNLLGKTPSKAIVDEFSNELQVSDNTPPSYITHAGDDKLVDVDNSIVFYEKLRHHNVAAELHLYPKGGHGFVLAQRPEVWIAPIVKWMQTLNN
jgi:acetyl esterase/lipase